MTDMHSDHGDPLLTDEQWWLCRVISTWIRIVRTWGPEWYSNWVPDDPDFAKSRLFWRLRAGYEPLAEPPPTAFSCPWYEVVEQTDDPHEGFEMRLLYHDPQNPNRVTHVAFCQEIYDVYELHVDGRVLCGKNRWRFWMWPRTDGPVEFKDLSFGWIQRAPEYEVPMPESPRDHAMGYFAPPVRGLRP